MWLGLREGDGFGGEVKEVGRKDTVGYGRILHIILSVVGSQWKFLKRGVT